MPDPTSEAVSAKDLAAAADKPAKVSLSVKSKTNLFWTLTTTLDAASRKAWQKSCATLLRYCAEPLPLTLSG